MFAKRDGGIYHSLNLIFRSFKASEILVELSGIYVHHVTLIITQVPPLIAIRISEVIWLYISTLLVLVLFSRL